MPEKILVVDDSATDRLIIKNMLNEYNVLTACDGLEAMGVINEHEDIDLIILDLNMPNMNGFQILSTLKSRDKYKNLRAIILTNYDEIDNEIKGLELGAIDYIRKPIHMESLKIRIGIHIELLRVQQLLEHKLHENTLTFDVIFQHAPIGIAISYRSEASTDNKSIASINPVFEQITGRKKKELVELGWSKITHPEDIEEDMKNYEKFQSGEIDGYTMEKRYIRPDGSIVWVLMIVAPLPFENNTKFNNICIIQDITDRKEHELKYKYLSEHDTLTGLYNRKYFEELLAYDAISKSNVKRAIINVNLSKIDLLTITYGFNYSQALIKKVAIALSSCCTNNYQLFSTYTNRFTIYLKDYHDKRELIRFCDDIIKVLESVLSIERIGGGLGILEIDENERDVKQILKNVLIASENALSNKSQKFSYSFFDREMELKILRQMKIVEVFDEIVAGDDSSIYMQFQPIFDLKSNSICSFEALTRIKSLELGIVAPLEFIPIAEETKQIIPIGKRIIYHSLNFLNKLKAKGYNSVNISINISVIQLLADDFNSSLLELLDNMGIAPTNLIIEITESIFSDNFCEITKNLEKLRALGIQIAIDDFGTGYSSFAREQEIDANYLKIDKYFIDKLVCVNQKQDITSDLISMAHKLGHYVVAEGVEHEIQKQYLFEYGCDMVQGYLISRPLEEEDAINLLQKINEK